MDMWNTGVMGRANSIEAGWEPADPILVGVQAVSGIGNPASMLTLLRYIQLLPNVVEEFVAVTNGLMIHPAVY